MSIYLGSQYCTNKKDVTSSQRQHVLRFSVTSADGLIKWFLLFQERSILHSTVLFESNTQVLPPVFLQSLGAAGGSEGSKGSSGHLARGVAAI